MTIQKKSLISSLNTTKKAIVASSPVETPTSTEKPVKLAAFGASSKLGRMGKLGKLGRMGKLGKLGRMGKLGKLGKLGKV